MLRTALTIALLAAAAPLAAANLVTNGNFETASVASNHQIVGNDLTGWTTSTSIYKYNYLLDATSATATPFSYDGHGTGADDRRLPASFPGVSPDGGNFVGLDGDKTYGSPLSQTINGLLAGHSYKLSFDWAATQIRNRTGPTTNQFLVSLGSETHGTPVVNVDQQGFDGWYKASFIYTATASTEVLSFLANGSPVGLPPYALLDGVSLNAVPEPATWALLLVGFGFVGARRAPPPDDRGRLTCAIRRRPICGRATDSGGRSDPPAFFVRDGPCRTATCPPKALTGPARRAPFSLQRPVNASCPFSAACSRSSARTWRSTSERRTRSSMSAAAASS